ncbi:glycoside hydrolase family 43 protein [Alkalihalobacterium bogoriense]|uniref:glycoside hydrolase family 43 protein n=1 Tax=Alkalihalobacterium bogoriense TaxID=246272 RepID=UPI00047D5AF4|nr:glycoside hydrolase family 43 protein [Alkalihalobacterium bogoriense]
MNRLFTNPILPGSYADPSICRVGKDFYLVTSSFEYYPGIPVFHSRDLVHWRQIGHVLDRPSQLNLDGTPCSKGIYAPTIRYHDGLFYVSSTFVESATGARRNFYVTATSAFGPWSDPIWLPEAPGIDSSLFFDDDGKCYILANRKPPSGQLYPKHMEIWMQELDVNQGRLLGPKYSLWEGAQKWIHAQEAPHLYKLNGYYYLFIAEGGTGFTHSVTVARSQSITGPYEGCKSNPILTHCHLGRSHPITNIGHADIIQTEDGEWWMVCLGSRPYGGFSNLGRETFLVPFIWEEDWPVVNPGIGKVELKLPCPSLSIHPWPTERACDHFDTDTLAYYWNYLRTPRQSFLSLTDRPGFLRLKLKPDKITEVSNPSFIGRRQQHKDFAVRTVMEFTPNNEYEKAGLVLFQNHDFQYRVEYSLKHMNKLVTVIARIDGVEQVLAEHILPDSKTNDRLFIKVEASGQQYSFYFASKAEQWIPLYEKADGTILSMEKVKGFSGAYIGLFTSSNGKQSDNYADFDYFEYLP